MPLIPAIGRQRQMDLCEFNADLVYRASTRTGFKATQRNLVLRRGKRKSHLVLVPTIRQILQLGRGLLVAHDSQEAH